MYTIVLIDGRVQDQIGWADRGWEHSAKTTLRDAMDFVSHTCDAEENKKSFREQVTRPIPQHKVLTAQH